MWKSSKRAWRIAELRGFDEFAQLHDGCVNHRKWGAGFLGAGEVLCYFKDQREVTDHIR